jgi:oligoribonuclease NrnB/cAMP/cGMP phosphodiesterase (DHH superfamily)
MSKDTLVIFHGPGCLDGMAAANSMYTLFGTQADYVVGRYQSNDEIDFRGKEVYLVDFSYKRSFILENILPVAKSLTIIDHHKSALEDLAGLDTLFPAQVNMAWCSNDYSGAVLAYLFTRSVAIRDYQKSPCYVPPLLLVIQDRDLWKFEIPGTREITAALFARRIDYKSIGMYVGMGSLNSLVIDGNVLLEAHEKECEVLLKIATRLMHFQVSPEDCYPVDVTNCPPKYASDMGNMLAKQQLFGATYYDTQLHREFSLRSIGDFDVSEVAKVFGGGGHRNAAGFKVPRSHYLAQQ